MLSLRKPSAEAIREFLESQSKLDFSYPAVGATATAPPSGYNVDHTRLKLGEGSKVFESAKAALQRWQQFQLAWVEAYSPDAAIRVGGVVAIVACSLGLWWTNACRVIYVLDETGPATKFGFAYGTLPDHAERGEERFLLEWNHADDSVWYDILAFSQPHHILARIGKPYVRRVQKRFARESAAVMRKAVVEA